MVIAISLLVLVTFVLAFVGIFQKKDDGSSTKLRQRLEAFKNDAPAVTAKADESSHFKTREYSGNPILSRFFGRMKGSDAMANLLERAGLPLRVGEFYIIRWVVATLFFLAPQLFGFLDPFMILVSLGLALVGYMLPVIWVNGKRNKRTTAINTQLVDLLGMVANSLKSGYGLMQSFEFASKQLPDPLGMEVRRMLREATLGLSSEQALAQLGRRLDSKDMDMVITAINIQRSVGGNLAEILENVAFTMRERERIRGEITTLTSQQRMTGIVIGLLPLIMFGLFMVMNPDYMSVLFNTTPGRLIILAAAFMEVLGYFTIKRIIAIEV